LVTNQQSYKTDAEADHAKKDEEPVHTGGEPQQHHQGDEGDGNSPAGRPLRFAGRVRGTFSDHVLLHDRQ
jgi:hypothetical protein